MNKNTSTRTGMEIAVIGMAGKFPKANNLEEYWDNLKDGKDCITFFKEEELHLSKEEEKLKEDPNYVKAKGYLDGKEYFDEKFFEYSKSDAEIMDPQMRLFHECVWSALEDAGQNVKKDNPIGLYGGASANTYWKLVTKLQSIGDHVKSFSDEQLSNEEFMCTKIAYKLNLKGPAVYVKTACSTSMAAIHMACRSLLTGECKVAVAGGVSLLLPDKKGYLYREGMIFSPDGYCRAFDNEAHGTVGGEGVGAVVLKRLKDAEADGDHIYAVVKGSAMNNDGGERIGYTAPGVNGQASVIRKAHRLAKVNPDTITYVEAHGTGTELGDPIEVEALQEAFSSTNKQFCALGSVKSNIGHLDSASGVASFIKTVLALYHKEIPPTIHYNTPNRKINFKDSPFFVNNSLRKWESKDGCLRAGVSSFGMGGTNVHVVLENYEYPQAKKEDAYNLLMFSGKNAGALNRMLAQWKDYLDRNQESDLSEIAYILGEKRSRFGFRKAIGCYNAEEAKKKMESIQIENIKNNTKSSKKIVFMFPGQGKQYIKMGYGLYQKIPSFRKDVDRCFSLYSKYDQTEIEKIWLYGIDQDVMKTSIAQPIVFIMEYCIAKLLMHYEIKPDVVMGYSLGEYVAACIAGVFSLEDGLYMVNIRGKLMEQTEKGVMLNIPLDRKRSETYIAEFEDLSIAVDNGDSCIVAGTLSAIEECEKVLRSNKIISMRIGVDYACHSHLMEPILEQYENALKSVTFHENEISMISCVTGQYVEKNEITRISYWSSHITRCVNYYKAIKTLDESKEKHVLIETGPGRNLLTMALREIPKEKILCGIDTIRIQSRDIPDVKFLYDKLGILYDNGINIGKELLPDRNSFGTTIFPLYPFEKNSFGKQMLTSEALDIGKCKMESISGKQIYMQNWVRTIKQNSVVKEGEKWIVFSNHNIIAEEVINRLSWKNTISAQISSEEFYQAENKLVELFKEDGIYNILYAYSLDCYEEGQEIYCNNLFKISQLCGAASGNVKLQLFILSSNANEVVGCDLKYPDKAMLNAAVKVIPQEYLNIAVKLIDLDESDYDCVDKLAENVYLELGRDFTDKLVAYRRNYRMIPSYTNIAFENRQSCIREDGVYILFGGLGGIGQAVAGYLIEQYRVKLVLAGTRVVTSEYQNELLTKQKNCEYVTCDILDYENVNGLFTYTYEKYGKVDGVFNMTAVADGCLIQMRRPEDSQRVIEPKYQGTKNLIKACKKHQADLLVLFSSLSSITGGVGQAAYCAANSYLDACSYYNENFNGIKTICIDWDRWKHTGISNKLEKIHFDLTGSIMEDGLDVESAVSLLDQCLRLEYPHLIALSTNIESFFVQGDVAQDVQNQQEKEKDTLDRSCLSSEYVSPESAMEKELVTLWEQELLTSPIGIQDDFLELGGDSLKAIIMLAKIEKNYRRKVLVANFLTEPTIYKLARLLKEAVTEKTEEKNGKYYTELDDKARAYVERISQTTEVEDAYYLSQMQNMTLSYNIMHQTDGKNVSIFECVIQGMIDVDNFIKAWHEVILHNPVLRSTIVWRRVPEPLQIIRKDVVDHVWITDLSDLDDNDYWGKIEQIRADEMEQSFHVTDYPLYRFQIVKRNQTEYNLIVSYLNSLFDGWSTSILLRDIQKYYFMLRRGAQIETEKEKTSHYFAALKMQRDMSKEKLENFWKNEFLGYNFQKDNFQKLDILENATYHAMEITIEKSDVHSIYQFAKEKKITLNSYLQGCWVVLLSSIEQNDDIITGYISSGRDIFNDDMLDNVGLFTNIVPLRTVLDDKEQTSSYFVNVHKHINRINQNSFLMISVIEDLVQAPKDYFEQISYAKTLTLIQYPVKKDENKEFSVGDVISNTSVSVPLRAYILIDDSLHIKIQYGNWYEEKNINNMLVRFKNIVKHGVEEQTIKELKMI